MSNQTPGHLTGKKKWLVTRYPKPPGKLIFLGSILTDPEEPETSLNRATGALHIPEQDTIDDSAAVRQQIHSELSSNAGGILKVVPPSSLLFSAGLRVEGRSSKEVNTTVEAMNVSAKTFIPDKSYIDEALKGPEITKFLKDCAWSESLYMIVGVATAETLELAEEQKQESVVLGSANASLGETRMGIAGELSRGTMAGSGSRGRTRNASDFAYRVREFEYMKYRPGNKIKDKGNRSQGALFGKSQDEDEFCIDEVYVPIFDCWAEEDEELGDLFVFRT